MLLVDLSQVILSNIFESSRDGSIFEEDVARPMILNSIRAINKKFSGEYGELVIAADGSKLWRREAFPYYKANRKRARAESTIDWKGIFEILNTVRDEIRDNFPYRVVQAVGAEADDVIGTLVSQNSLEHINNNNRILIVSGDKDFIQLQRYPNVEQYDPVKKKKIQHADPVSFTMEHIIRGDVGDGIPNILSSDDCLVLGTRQRPITSKKIESWKKSGWKFEDEVLRNFKRNELLIDLSHIPEEVRARINQSYESQAGKDKSKILRYMMNKRLGSLLDSVNDF